MTYRQAVKMFRETYSDLYEQGVDYWTAHECWANFTDIMCKNGDITQKQYDTWETPFPYGQRLGVKKVYVSIRKCNSKVLPKRITM